MKKFIVGLIFCISCFAQQSTIYQTLWLNIPGDTSTASIKNIGQTSHQGIIVAFGSGGGCGGTLTFFGGTDGLNYITLASMPFSSPNGVYTTTQIVVNGLYPFAKLQVSATTNCVTSGYYLGSKSVIDPFIVDGITTLGNRKSLQMNNFGDLNVTDLTGRTFGNISLNGTTIIRSAASQNVDVLKQIIVGTKGVTSSLTLTTGGNTILVLDTTLVGSYNVGWVIPPGNDLTAITTGGTPANITFIY